MYFKCEGKRRKLPFPSTVDNFRSTFRSPRYSLIRSYDAKNKLKTSIYFAIEFAWENLFRRVRVRAHMRALMTRRSCVAGMRNAIQKKRLNKWAANDQSIAFPAILFTMFYLNNSWKLMAGRPTNQLTAQPGWLLVDLPVPGHRCCSLFLYAVTLYKRESLNLALSHKLLKHKSRVLLAGHTFALVSCSPMIEQLLISLLRSERRWSRMVVLHKKEVQKSWKLVPATLKGSTAFMMSTANLK